MDVLDKYKETWKNQQTDTQKVSKVDIYKMAHKKSSSIVKWIFIIGILEFIFVATINFMYRINPTFNKAYFQLKTLFIASEVASYTIMIYFLLKFYKNYKSISTSDDTKTLMSKILKTRRTVRNYMLTIIIVSALFLIPIMLYLVQTEEFKTTHGNYYLVLIISFIVVLGILLLFYWVYYQVLYGILLRKLNRNYKELAKLDELN